METEQQHPAAPSAEQPAEPPAQQPAEPSAEHHAEQPAQPPPGTGPQQPPPPQGPPPAGWGAPPPPASRARWSVRRTIVAVAIAVGIAAAGGVAIYAAGNSTSDNQGGPGGVGGGPGGMRGNGPVMGGPLADAEHGEFQNGEVTAISDDSITAKSDDGYTRTYVIDADTVLADGVGKGDDVMIVAATSSADDKATATMVTEQGQQGVLPPRRDGQNGGQGGRGTPPTR